MARRARAVVRPGWKQTKIEVRARDRVCRACGATPEQNGRALDVHHLEPFRFSGDNSLANLVALCRSCHMRADDHGRAGPARYLRHADRPAKREIARLRAALRRAELEALRGERKRRARDLRARGLSLRAVAGEIGVSHETVSTWLDAERDTMAARSRRSAADRARAVELHARGLTTREIGARLGVSYQAVARWLAREGVREASTPYTAA